MATVFHISEEDAARDFPALMDRVRCGEEIVVEDSGHPVAVLKAPEQRKPLRGNDPVNVRGKTAEEILESLARWEAEHGKLIVDEYFAADMQEAHEWADQPLDETKWD